MCCFSFITVINMTSGDEDSNDSHSRMEDETIKPLMPLENVKLSMEGLESEYFHKSLLTLGGTIFQFINGGCAGAASMIGAIRCNLTEARKIPAYVQQYKDKIKVHAVNALERHFRDSQCAVGVGETLTIDDYGLSFALASVTPAGAQLNPFKRPEGPLYFCLYPNLCEATALEPWNQNSTPVVAHIVNVYVHLLPAAQRRLRVLAKLTEDNAKLAIRNTEEIERKKAKLSPTEPTFSKGPWSNPPPTYAQRKEAEARQLREENASLKEIVCRFEKQQKMPTPPLPPTKGVVWPPKNARDPEMPDDL